VLNTSLEIRENVPLAPLTTLKVGGPARFFVEARSDDDVVEAFELAREKGWPVFVLGGGSNILVADRGFDGLVVRIALAGVSLADDLGPNNVVTVTAAAGQDWDNFVSYCVENDLAGVECLSGIPGLVGGTPVQNVGAYGQEVSDIISAVRCYDRQTREIIELTNTDCQFAYRSSIFNTTKRGRHVVLAVTFRLARGGAPKIEYKDLKERFGDHRPSLAETRAAVLTIRRAKSMVIDTSDPNSCSAGSFFKNPVVFTNAFNELEAKLGTIPHYSAGTDKVKLPAAWLIEKAGFNKGYVLGRAGLSSNHTLAIINRGGASAADIIELKSAVVRAVSDKFGIELQPEPVFVGF
jgi:UDP-N-acetylmuramate dehydrogenase